MYIYICIYMCIYICVCVRVIYFLYIYICICVWYTWPEFDRCFGYAFHFVWGLSTFDVRPQDLSLVLRQCRLPGALALVGARSLLVLVNPTQWKPSVCAVPKKHLWDKHINVIYNILECFFNLLFPQRIWVALINQHVIPFPRDPPKPAVSIKETRVSV